MNDLKTTSVLQKLYRKLENYIKIIDPINGIKRLEKYLVQFVD